MSSEVSKSEIASVMATIMLDSRASDRVSHADITALARVVAHNIDGWGFVISRKDRPETPSLPEPPQ